MAEQDPFHALMRQLGVQPLAKAEGPRAGGKPASKRKGQPGPGDQDPAGRAPSASGHGTPSAECQEFLQAMAHGGPLPDKDLDSGPGQKLTVRQLKRPAKARPEEVLDLHGMTAEQARQALALFCLAHFRAGTHCALVITGKGLHSAKPGGVLRALLEEWIQCNGKRYVRAFAPAPRALGGQGAFQLFFRSL
jgi:DNA-nicking Smr family endonuclease